MRMSFNVLVVSCVCLLSARAMAETASVAVSGAEMKDPFAVDFDKDGNMYVAHMVPNKISKVDKDGKITVIAGDGTKAFGGDGGPSTAAKVSGPHHLLVSPDQQLYIADTWNSRVRKIDLKTGIITTFAGTGGKGFGGDGGPADKAQTGNIYCIAFDAKFEKMYLDDLDNKRIRVVDMKTGIISTFAGNGQKGVPADGSVAKDSPLQDPRAVTCDSKGNVYILERGGHNLRVVDTEGKVKTIAGTGKAGPSKDGGEALKTPMSGPKHLSVDAEDNVLITDTENHSILKYLPKEGKLVRIAGTGKRSPETNANPLEMGLARPHGAYLDKNGVLWISDSENSRIVKIVK
jgi:DNA-binding beta-propeller fold protein YncE